MTGENPVSDRVERIEQIIEILEDGEVSLERAQDLHEEGQEILEALQDELAVADGNVVDE